MGGSSSNTQTSKTPTQTPQSTAAYNTATGAASTLAGLGNTYSGEQQQMYNLLWGTPSSGTPSTSPTGAQMPGTNATGIAGNPATPVTGNIGTATPAGTVATAPKAPALSTPAATPASSAGTSGGALTGFLNPASLNVTSPTGPFAGAYTNTVNQDATAAAQNAQQIQQNAAQAGFGANTPAAMTQDELEQNNQQLANNVGTAYTTETGNAYDAALSNFWNAANAASGQAATAQSGATGATGSAAQIANNLYANSLGQTGTSNTQSTTSPLNSLISAGGKVGAAAAAACVMEGTLIISERSAIFAEDIKEGDTLRGIDGGNERVIRPPDYEMKPCVQVIAKNGAKVNCSTDHTLVRPEGGYVRAKDANGQEVLTIGGRSVVVKVHDIGIKRVVRIQLDRTHTFWSDRIASEE